MEIGKIEFGPGVSVTKHPMNPKAVFETPTGINIKELKFKPPIKLIERVKVAAETYRVDSTLETLFKDLLDYLEGRA